MIIFVFFLNMTPNYDALFTFYMTDELKFTTTDLANFAFIGTLSYIIGLILYSYWLIKIDARKFYLGTNFLLWIFNVAFMLVVLGWIEKWGLDNKTFCFMNQGIFSLINEINFMPILAIWCGICPKNLEATSITLFTGILNFSWAMASYFSSLLIVIVGFKSGHYENMWHLLVIQNSYLLLTAIAIMFAEFPDSKKIREEAQLEMVAQQNAPNQHLVD